MTILEQAGQFTLGDKTVWRLGYGAMQLAGPGVFGPPKDPEMAIRVLRAAIDAGVNHIDTADFYGPHITNQLIKQALHPYRDDLCIVTKVSARRDEQGNWIPAMSPAELTRAVEDNLRNLGLEQLDVVNLRSMLGIHQPQEGSLEVPLTTLAELKARGLIRHIGLSNVTARQIEEAQKITPVVCVQNLYNLVNRHDDALVDQLAERGIAWVPFFPLGGFTPLQSEGLNQVASELALTPWQVALAWLLQRAPNILLIPGTASLAHLEDNLAIAAIRLPDDALTRLNALADQTH